MAASSQVFDEARHFYILRDYLALLHVPVPAIDPYFATAARTLLDSRDLALKLLTMQILVEGSAQAIFQYLEDCRVEPVLSHILPYIARDEARHVGLGVLHLPQMLAGKPRAELRRLARRVESIGDLLGAAQIRNIRHYRALGLDPRELFRRSDRLLFTLADKLGKVPGTDQHYFTAYDPSTADYAARLDMVLPPPGARPDPVAAALGRIIDFGARALAA
jgi:hypothetical protein